MDPPQAILEPRRVRVTLIPGSTLPRSRNFSDCQSNPRRSEPERCTRAHYGRNHSGIHGIRASQTTCAGVKRLRFSWWRNAPCHACARVALLCFLVYEKSLLLTDDAACRGSSLTRLGPGHLMVSGDFCLSLSYLGATVSVLGLEQKTVLSFVAMWGGWRSFVKVRWVFYFLCTLTHTHARARARVNIFRTFKLNFSFASRIEGNSKKKRWKRRQKKKKKHEDNFLCGNHADSWW